MPDSPQPPPLDYASPSSNPRRGTHPLLVWSVPAILAIGFLARMLLPSLTTTRTPANIPKCGSNLRQLGQAMVLYANDHQGRYPDTMGDLLEEDITLTVFICPASNDQAATTAPTTQAAAANLLAGGHLSYIYLGKGTIGTPPANRVLAYEPLANHQNTGMNVLYGDGHVEFHHVPAATAMIAELTAGHNPPRQAMAR